MRGALACAFGIRLMTAASSVALAQTPTAASTPNVWYRSGDGCPDGNAFIERLSRRNVHAKLATVGDRVDFVVTLGTATGGYSGRLERQTSSGIVAIRSFESDSCADVADALALTLSLSAAGTAQAPPAPTAPSSSAAPAPVAPPAPAAPSASAAPPATAAPPPPVTAASPPSATRTPPPRASRRPPPSPPREGGSSLLGAEVIAETGVAPRWMPGIGVFFQRVAEGDGVLVPAFRLTALAARASSQTPDGELAITLFEGRLEACPLQLGGTSVVLRPCAGVEAGMIRGELSRPPGKTDSGPWLALVAHPRIGFALGPALELDASAGILVPLIRQEFVLAGDAAVLQETAAAAFQTGIGLAYSWR